MDRSTSNRSTAASPPASAPIEVDGERVGLHSGPSNLLLVAPHLGLELCRNELVRRALGQNDRIAARQIGQAPEFGR